MKARALVVLLAAALLALQAGCGRKAMPDPRIARAAAVAAQHDIAFSR